MRVFITSKNKYLSKDMKIFGTCSIPLIIISSFVKLTTVQVFLGNSYFVVHFHLSTSSQYSTFVLTFTLLFTLTLSLICFQLIFIRLPLPNWSILIPILIISFSLSQYLRPQPKIIEGKNCQKHNLVLHCFMYPLQNKFPPACLTLFYVSITVKFLPCAIHSPIYHYRNDPSIPFLHSPIYHYRKDPSIHFLHCLMYPLQRRPVYLICSKFWLLLSLSVALGSPVWCRRGIPPDQNSPQLRSIINFWNLAQWKLDSLLYWDISPYPYLTP